MVIYLCLEISASLYHSNILSTNSTKSRIIQYIVSQFYNFAAVSKKLSRLSQVDQQLDPSIPTYTTFINML